MMLKIWSRFTELIYFYFYGVVPWAKAEFLKRELMVLIQKWGLLEYNYIFSTIPFNLVISISKLTYSLMYPDQWRKATKFNYVYFINFMMLYSFTSIRFTGKYCILFHFSINIVIYYLQFSSSLLNEERLGKTLTWNEVFLQWPLFYWIYIINY